MSSTPAASVPNDMPHVHTHKHTYSDLVECCSHHNLDVERSMKLNLVGLTLVIASVVAGKLFGDPALRPIVQIPALIGTIMIAWTLFAASLKEIFAGKVTTSSLASLAILSLIVIGKVEMAGFIAFILLFADQLVRQRAWGAKQAIEQLVGLTPDTARVVRDGNEEIVPIEHIAVGDTVRVRPGENLSVDGTVTTGKTMINQASLTGEAAPHEINPGDPVYAGTTNISSVIDLRVTQVGQDTTIGKVSQLIAEAESSKSPKQLLIELFSRFFVPVALALAFAVWFIERNEERAIMVLIIACPSALLLSAPIATVAAFTSAARLGILIKQKEYLETAADIDTVVFDKTGTITEGNFVVSRLVPAEGIEGADLLQAAANGEQHSNHPLAKSILQTAAKARITPDGTSDFEEVHGRGIRAKTTQGEICVGRKSWIIENFPAAATHIKDVEPKIEGMSGVHVVRDGKYLGVVGLEDKTRAGAKDVVSELRELGVRSVAIFTGDRTSVAERVGRAIGVDRIEAECLPEDKHQRIEDLTKKGRRVLMVGDGINDGPSLAASDVGVAMGLEGSDIAANSAGVALMTDDLSRIPFLISLGRRTKAIISQNIVGSILIAIVGLAAAATGVLDLAGQLGLVLAAIYHVVGDVFVIGNSFRLLRFGEAYTETEDTENQIAPSPAARLAQLKPATA